MSRKLGLLATLSSLAAAGVVMTPLAASAQADPFFGLVTQLAESCLVEAPPGVYNVVTAPARIAACCAVVRRIGPENMDFLQAVALANRADPRLIVLDSQLVDVLLSCRQEALDRLAELAVAIAPAAGPTPFGTELYTG
ncbi:MAG: hypothetical protein KIT43_11150 [Bauldia sp.]|nr:hypothetical protein [Bauldia sp.]MCW5716411.1 hypothetical protein [Bauldia sp.]